jgi:FeS assembly protein IscX
MRWTDIEDIAEALEDNHPDEENIAHIRFTTLHSYVIELLDFDDDPSRSNERILEAIHAAWLKLRGEDEE